MIGKKINQLATELAPVSTDLTIIGDPTTGVSKKITLAQLGAIFSGAVSFYTNLAGFPATGDINVIYCAKDTKKLYLWDGTTYVEVFPSQALLDTYQLRSEKGVSNGYASLDSSGKVPISQLPSSIMEYKGTWNAATNTPTLANGTGDTGDVYICNVAGTVNFGAGPITFAVGDYVIYSGTIWQRSSGAVGTVTSVAATITGNAIGITGSPVTTSGTLAFAFAGTGAQYIKGDGTLATFPSTIAQAERLITEVYNSTGATLTKGTIVYINGGQGNLPTVTKALATGDSTSAQTFGVVQADITNMNNGYVVVAGKLSDLDTQAYTEGTQLYLSATTAGTWTSTKQYAPNHLVYVGIVVRAHPTQGIVEIKIQNGYELDEIHNVAAQNPDNNDILQYKTSTSLWTKVAGTTSNIAEGSNLYYTDARSRAALSFTAGSGAYNSTTGVITIPTNTNQLTNGAAYITLGSLSAGAGISYNNTTGVIASTITQYTDAMARASISLTTTGTSGAATYNSTTGVLNVPQYAPDLSGYVPTSRTLTINGTAYDLSANRSWSVGTVTSVGLSSATSGVTIGSTPVTTSGTITLAIATASGSQQGLLSSTDWTTFNNKQNALTNPVTGTGTTNYLPKFTGTSTIGNSAVSDDGTTVTLISRALSGTSATFSGNTILGSGADDGNRLQVNGSAFVKSGNSLYLGNNTNANYWGIQSAGTGATALTFQYNSGASLLSIASTGAATFSSSVTAVTQGLNSDFNAGAFIARASGSTTKYTQIGFDATNTYGWIQALEQGVAYRNLILNGAGGNVGIGTTSPTALLHLAQNTTNLNLYLQNTNGSGQTWAVNSDNLGKFNIHNTSVNVFTISGTNVGIGTTSPPTKFAVKDGTDTVLQYYASGADGYLGMGNEAGSIGGASKSFNLLTGTQFTFGTGGSTRMTITSGGDIRITSGGTTNAATLELTSSATPSNGSTIAVSYLGSGSYGPLKFGTGGSTRMTITSGGAVEMTGTIQTGAPTNGTAQPWRLGNAVSGSVSTNHYLIVSVNGTTYSIPALNGLP